MITDTQRIVFADALRLLTSGQLRDSPGRISDSSSRRLHYGLEHPPDYSWHIRVGSNKVHVQLDQDGYPEQSAAIPEQVTGQIMADLIISLVRKIEPKSATVFLAKLGQ